jgi:molybdopterin synthase catalytic subunit
MEVRVLFFGVLKDLIGKASDSISLAENATLGDVLTHYEQAVPRLKETAASLAMSVNQEYAGPGTRLRPGDEVALLPPVSGGADTAARRSQHAAIIRERIKTASILEDINRPEDGAAVVFEGIVRNHTRGRRTLYLEYEA